MKKSIILIMLSVGLFASDSKLCIDYAEKANKAMKLVSIDSVNLDAMSMRNNLSTAKVYLNLALMECDGKLYDLLLQYKTKIVPDYERMLK